MMGERTCLALSANLIFPLESIVWLKKIVECESETGRERPRGKKREKREKDRETARDNKRRRKKFVAIKLMSEMKKMSANKKGRRNEPTEENSKKKVDKFSLPFVLRTRHIKKTYLLTLFNMEI